MKNIVLLFLILVFPNTIFSQNSTFVSARSGKLEIPGKWEQLNTADDSGQIYFKNEENVIIAVALNPKNAYPFFVKGKTDFELVTMFYKWDSDWRKENKYETAKLKEDKKNQHIIWKYNDGKLDNIYLFGSIKDNFLNLLVYTEKWNEDEKIKFLEKIYLLNK